MATYNESIIRGGYVPFSLKKDYNLDVLGRTYDKLDEKSQKALEQASAIDLALSKIELNASEDSWKTNYINQIRKQIDSAAQFGNYATALSTATKLAGKALSDTALLGRVRANANYEEAKKQILNRNDINQITKDRWLEQNPYSYQDKYDNLGNVVGGTDWNPNWRPVSRYDMSQLYGLVKQLAAEEAGGGESAQFLDENGNLTSDPSKGFYGMAIKRGSEWHRLSEDKLKRVFNSLFKQAPEAMDALLQDMDDRHWQYEKTDDEGKKAFIGSDIMDDSGRMYSPQEYLEHRVNPVLHEMAYNRVKSSLDFGSAYTQKLKADKNKAANAALLSLDKANRAQAMTMPIAIDLKDSAGVTYATVNDAMKKLSAIVPKTMIKTAMLDGNYSSIADYAESVAENIKLNNNLKNDILANARLLRSESERLYRYTDGFTKEERDAFNTKSAIYAGVPMTDIENNSFSRQYTKLLNDLFSYTDGSGKHYTDDIILSFNSISDFENLKDAVGIGDSDYKKNGITVRTFDGKPSIVIHKDSSLIRDIATKANNYEIKYRDSKGNIKNDYYNVAHPYSINLLSGAGSPTALSSMLAGQVNTYSLTPNNNTRKLKDLAENNAIERNLDAVIDKAFKRLNKNSVVPIEVMPADDITTLTIDEMYRQGLIDRATHSDEVTRNEKNTLNQVAYALSHPGNISVYAPNEFGGVGYKLGVSDSRIKDIAQEVLVGIADDRVSVNFVSEPTPAGYGTIVRINPKVDSKGMPLGETKVYYFDGLLHSDAATAVAKDPEKFIRGEFVKDRAIGTPIKDINNNIIDYNSPTAFQQYKLNNNINEVRNAVRHSIENNEPVKESEIIQAIQGILLSNGVNPESDYYKAVYEKLYSELMNM